jgi:hypothetical protein
MVVSPAPSRSGSAQFVTTSLHLPEDAGRDASAPRAGRTGCHPSTRARDRRNGLTGARLAVQLYLREAPAQTDTEALEVALRQLTLLETHVKRFLDIVGEAVGLLRPQCRHSGIALA